MTSVAAPGSVRLLTEADRSAIEGVLSLDPISNVFVASRIDSHGVSQQVGAYGAQLWGFYLPAGGRFWRRTWPLRSICFAGANLIPINASTDAIEAFAFKARVAGRMCSSLVGDAPQVLQLWARLERYWGTPREVRPDQPVLATRNLPRVAADTRVRLAHAQDFDALLPACVAMYTEEVGTSPLEWDGGRAFRARVRELIDAGHMYVLLDRSGQTVEFKAEVGAMGHGACQIQGVWVRPELRGHGVGTAAMAAVTADVLTRVAPVASLYVNAYNDAARVVYERCGFTQHATFATVLF